MTTWEKCVCVTAGREGRVSSVGGAELPKDGLLSDLITDGLVAIVEVPQGYLHQKLQDSRRVLILLENIALEEAIDCSHLYQTQGEMELDGEVLVVLLLVEQSLDAVQHLFELTLNSLRRTCLSSSFSSRRM